VNIGQGLTSLAYIPRLRNTEQTPVQFDVVVQHSVDLCAAVSPIFRSYLILFWGKKQACVKPCQTVPEKFQYGLGMIHLLIRFGRS